MSLFKPKQEKRKQKIKNTSTFFSSFLAYLKAKFTFEVFKKQVVWSIITALVLNLILPYSLATQNFASQNSAQAFSLGQVLGGDDEENSPADLVDNSQPLFDLVTIVVDSDLYADNQNYQGLSNQYSSQLRNTTIKDRILRYADDISQKYDFLDVKILQFDAEQQDVRDLSLALENLYFNGENDRNSELTGVVLVGDIPLPVVSKEGNKFISMYPYTDFIDKAYLYNSQNGNFERNIDSVFPMPEIWHGVIKSSQEDQISAKLEIAQFFDKNHLYYQDHPDFSNFQKKMFFADMVQEEEMINSDIFTRYTDYIETLEDQAYKRYNKHWANELAQKSSEGLAFNPDSQAGNEFANQFQSDNLLGLVPDIQTARQIESNLFSYTKLLPKYLSQVNDFARSTGRYNPQNVESIPVLIEMKDTFAKEYLKTVADALEAQVNQIAETIQEPIPIVTHSVLTGSIGGNTFSANVEASQGGIDLPTFQRNFLAYRFHYLNEVNDTLYVNGTPADILENPQMCTVYQGSTKSEYYDQDLNFNPKNVEDGEYSILTRSLRTDNSSTQIPKLTTGVNTRMIAPLEASNLTGVAQTGAIIEDDIERGIPAFSPNFIRSNYSNPLEARMEEGDLIVSVNQEPLSASFNFDDAVKKAVDQTFAVVNAVNSDNLDQIDDIDAQVRVRQGDSLNSGSISSAKSNLTLEFYRDGEIKEETFTFTVTRDGLFSTGSSSGLPRILVVQHPSAFSQLETILTPNVNFDSGSDGAVFALDSTRDLNNANGFDNNGYDLTAGCSANSARQNSDRCAAKLAAYPVFDAAGATQLLKQTSPDGSTSLGFPENIQRADSGENSSDPEVISQHYSQFQLDPNLDLEDIDEVIINSCYAGLPGASFLDGDSNYYNYPLDAGTFTPLAFNSSYYQNFVPLTGIISLTDPSSTISMDFDYYGKLLSNFGNFIAEFGSQPEISPFKDQIWQDIDELTAADIVLNDAGGNTVTLKTFADLYGIFDGIDNDGDGVRDYRLVDLDGDGIQEREYDEDEASLFYAIPSSDLDQIARKMLSHQSTYVIPEDLSPFGEEIVLNVNPNSYEDKEISSLIIHNEPTKKTLYDQLSAIAPPFSLPIDNPRYVKFLTPPEEPVSSDSHYYPGSMERIDYVNLFEVGDYNQLLVSLNSLADQIAATPGAYRLVNGSTSTPLSEIKESVLNDYLLPVVNGLSDTPSSGINLEIADGAKLSDTLEWITLGIDEKHEYILSHYLDPFKNAYINDNKGGYEAAYLVLNSDSPDYFETNFNKTPEEDQDPRFNPLATSGDNNAAGDGEGDGEDGSSGIAGSGGDNRAEDEFEFVPLTEFLAEIERFLDELTELADSEIDFSQTCSFEGDFWQDQLVSPADGNDLNSSSAVTNAEISRIEILANETQLSSENSLTNIEVRALDEEGRIISTANNRVSLQIIQDDNNPVLEFYSEEVSSFNGGISIFPLLATGRVGSAQVRASLDTGISSNTLEISNSDARIALRTYTALLSDEESEIESENLFQYYEENPESPIYISASSQITANGEDLLKVEAEVFDADGNTVQNQNIRFSIIAEDDEIAEILGGSIVPTQNGVATAYIRAGTVTGDFEVRASVVNNSFPPARKEINVSSGEATSVEIIPDSRVVAANGEAKITVNFRLRDRNGNTANNSFSTITVFVDGGSLKSKESQDLNLEIPGIQLSAFEGLAQLELLSTGLEGESTIFALLLDYETETQFAQQIQAGEEVDFTQLVGTTDVIEAVDPANIDLNFVWNRDFIEVANNTLAKASVELRVNGTRETSYNGPLRIEVLTPQTAQIEGNVPDEMVNGYLNQENIKLKSGNKAGRAEIQVILPGVISKTTGVDVLAGDPAMVELQVEDNVIESGETTQIKALLLDVFGNLVKRDNQTNINFELSNYSQQFASLEGGERKTVSSGEASQELLAGENSGEVNLAASGNGLSEGTLSLEVKKIVRSQEVKDFNTDALYVSLLGGPFADLSKENNLAESVLFNGNVQALSSASSSTQLRQRMFGVEANGLISILSEAVSSKVIMADSSLPYQQVVLSDSNSESDLAAVILVPNENSSLVYLEDEEVVGTESENSIIVEAQQFGDISAEISEEQILFEREEEVIASVDNFGRISLVGENLEIVYEQENKRKFMTLNVLENGVERFSVTYKQNFSDEVQISNENQTLFSAGVWIKNLNQNPNFTFEQSLSGNSTSAPKGQYLVNRENTILESQKPGFSYQSSEDANEKIGVGFGQDNKHMLLYTAGNSVGESNKAYASDITMVMGDPLIRVEVDDRDVSPLSGFSKDIGEMVLAGAGDVQQIINFDYNGDFLEDLLVIYDDGLVRLLENRNSSKRLKDKGFILNIAGGINDLEVIDYNGDGLLDLIVSTVNSCSPGENSHMALYENLGGKFELQPVSLDIDGIAVDIEAADMNNDQCTDAVVVDSAGNIQLFLNQPSGDSCSGLNENYEYRKNYGIELDNSANLVDSLYINYIGMPQIDTSQYQNAGKVIQAKIESDSSSQSPAGTNLPTETSYEVFDFNQIREDSNLGLNANKVAIDQNGGTVKVGDIIEYQITVRNNLSNPIQNFKISDIFPSNTTLVEDSLECLEGNCNQSLRFEETKTLLRDYIIRGMNIDGNSTLKISYEVIINSLPQISIELGNDFVEYPNEVNDGFRDIYVKNENNSEAEMIFLYSRENNGSLSYTEFVYRPELTNIEEARQNEREERGFGDILSPEALENPESLTDAAEEALSSLQNATTLDADLDGCIDSIDSSVIDIQSENYLNALNSSEGTTGSNGDAAGSSSSNSETDNPIDLATSIAESVSNVSSLYRCSAGGCLPIPYNYAFFAPYENTPGMPVFAAGSVAPYVFFFTPHTSVSTQVRVYLNPTLTMGLGGAVCVGPSIGSQSPCFAYALPDAISTLSGGNFECDDLLGPVNEAVSYASEAALNPEQGMSTFLSSEDTPTDSDTNSVEFSSNDSDAPFAVNGKVNVRIPGFPSVLTDWADNQIEEIYDKLLDLPDFYLIYPDGSSLGSEFAAASQNFGSGKIRNVNDFMRAVNSLPLIQIEGKEVMMKVPAIQSAEIEKYRSQVEFWLEYHRNELEKIEALWNCDLSNERRTICDIVTLEMTDLIREVEELMQQLDAMLMLPRKLLSWREIEAKYAIQIICYLDAVMQMTGGYMSKQSRIIESWFKAVEDVIKIFSDWQVVLDLFSEYQASCDQCKSDRVSKLGLILDLFLAIPEIPVVEFPKLPDVVFDFSKVRTGVKIEWPDLVFRPEPVRLPDLPVITLPDTLIPELTIDVPTLDLDLGFDFLLDFQLPDLPNLPAFPTINLPDLPRPPQVPSLPDFMSELALDLKEIFKILCLLKNGLLPVPEWALGTEIETLTQPSVASALPFISNLSFNTPGFEYEWAKEFKIEAQMSFEIETSFIYKLTENLVKGSNETLEEFIDQVNEVSDLNLQAVVDAFLESTYDTAEDFIESGFDGVDDTLEDVEDETGVSSSAQSYAPTTNDLNEAESIYEEIAQLEDFAPFVGKYKDRFESFDAAIKEYNESHNYDDIPEEYYLVAEEGSIDANHPLLNRNLAQIERDILEGDYDEFAEGSYIAEMRDSLIAYVNEIEEGNIGIKENFDGNIATMLANNDTSLGKLASLGGEPSSGIREKEFKGSFFGAGVEERVRLAADIDFDASSAISQASTSDAEGVRPSKGFYIAIGEEGESILDYTDEIDDDLKFISIDIDNDDDLDMVYSMGGDIYLKTSRLEQNVGLKGRVTSGEVDDFSNYQPVVENFVLDNFNNGNVELSWKKSEGAAAYEIVLFDSFDERIREEEVRFLAINDEMEEEELERLREIRRIEAENEVKVRNFESPSVSLELENGEYFASVFAVYEDGGLSLEAENILLNPQVCADTDQPLPVIGNLAEAGSLTVPLFAELEIDASESIDVSSEIASYYVQTLPVAENRDVTELADEIWSDTNASLDSDGDGNPNNDRDNPIIKIGPFEKEGDLGERDFVLYVEDRAGNSTSLNLTVNIVTPEISLDEDIGLTNVVSGEIEPGRAITPYSLIRERKTYRIVDGELKAVNQIEKIVTDSIGARNRYYSDLDGSYEINDLNLEDLITLTNAEGEVFAEVDPNTGNINIIDDSYSLNVLAAELPDLSTRIEIIDGDGNVAATVYPVADPGADVRIYNDGEVYDSEGPTSGFGVHLEDRNSEDLFEIRQMPITDIAYPGGASIYYIEEEKYIAVVDTSGNVVSLDDRLSLQMQENELNENIVLEASFEEEVIAEITIAALRGEERAIVVDEVRLPAAKPNAPSHSIVVSDQFNITNILGIDDPELRRIAKELYERGIIEGEEVDGSVIINPDEIFTRQEFVKTLLIMLCIAPRPEAYEPFSPNEANGGFSDLEFNPDDPYFPYIKEAALRGFVVGYIGDIDEESGLAPFRPESEISRAEVVKIILEVLGEKGVLDTSNLSPEASFEEGVNWFDQYIEAGLNFEELIIEGQDVSSNFLITEEEALEPNSIMTKGYALILVKRVLDTYSCFDLDGDEDGITDFCAETYDIDDPDADEDNDGLTNAQECALNTNPLNPDTDGGGVNDGDEYFGDTNPLSAFDDPVDDDNDGASNAIEILIGTNPNRADSDGGGVNDGDELARGTDPLDNNDDSEIGRDFVEDGVYIIPAECNTCPCEVTVSNSADLTAGDTIYTVISNYAEGSLEKIFAISNKVEIK